MRAQRVEALGVRDGRRFHLLGYRHGHSQVLIRGLPEPDAEDDDGGAPVRAVDFLFAGVARVSCWKDFGDFELRRPQPDELAVLTSRLGPLGRGEHVFLLEAGTLESHIVAARVYWAEFEIGGGAPSPLASEDPAYRAAHPPVGGLVRYAD